MFKIRYTMMAVCAAAALFLLACSEGNELDRVVEGQIVYPSIRINVAEMEMSESASRAASPMSPDLEKYVRTLALFEFDREGLHTNSPTTYHFIDFVAGTVDGKTGVGSVQEGQEFGVVESDLKGIALESHEDGMICLVANVVEDSVRNFYDRYKGEGQSSGNITFEQFKQWSLTFDYEKRPEVAYDETVSGYPTSMYMFGYYQGEIDAADPGKISVDLGRLASRLDITVVNETGATITKRLGYHFDDVCHSAYFFPMKMSRPVTYAVSLSRTLICKGEGESVDDGDFLPETFADGDSHTHYYYVAAHSALDAREATKLHLFYNSRVVGETEGTEDVPDEGGSAVKIPLCNVVPTEAGGVVNGYSLSRNTRYHFTIRLKKAGRAAPIESRSVHTGVPGEIIVYLP